MELVLSFFWGEGHLSPSYEFSLFKFYQWMPFIINNNEIRINFLAGQYFK